MKASQGNQPPFGALPESIGIRQCSYNLFSLLGVQPALGRFFMATRDGWTDETVVPGEENG